MATTTRNHQGRGLARLLGAFSIALGVAELTAPDRVCRLVGVPDDTTARRVTSAMGVREIASGMMVLEERIDAAGLWARVAGDAADLTSLWMGALRRPGCPDRAALASAGVAAVTVLDVIAATRRSRRGRPRSMATIRKAVTIRRPQPEVEEAWRRAEQLRREVEQAGATVRFAPAPGGRGTEVIVQFLGTHRPPDPAAALKKVTGRDLATRLADDLRLFKEQVETGLVVRSESTPTGHLLEGHLRQRPARPLQGAR